MYELAKRELIKRIAGEIVLSKHPGQALSKWRAVFGISQRALGEFMQISASVISDYEHGRRASPGIKMVARAVNAIVEFDEKRGGKVVRELVAPLKTLLSSFIIDLGKFKPCSPEEFCEKIGAEPVVLVDGKIDGYIVIDADKALSLDTQNKAVIAFGASKLLRLMKPKLLVVHKSELGQIAQGTGLAFMDYDKSQLLNRLKALTG